MSFSEFIGSQHPSVLVYENHDSFRIFRLFILLFHSLYHMLIVLKACMGQTPLIIEYQGLLGLGLQVVTLHDIIDRPTMCRLE